jgi:hypothetical protein
MLDEHPIVIGDEDIGLASEVISQKPQQRLVCRSLLAELVIGGGVAIPTPM